MKFIHLSPCSDMNFAMEKYLLTEKSCENCSGVNVGAWVVSAGVPSSCKGLVLIIM